MSLPNHRDEIRSSMIAWRKRLSSEDLARRAERLAGTIGPWIAARDVRVIGTYAAFRGELDPGSLRQLASLANVRFAYPVIDDTVLRFGIVRPETTWATNRFGISEPQSAELLDVADLDIVLVPCVAVDRSGNRLGFGAGWYDRTLATAPPIERVGLVHDEQIVEELTPEHWDVPLTTLATPHEVVGVDRR